MVKKFEVEITLDIVVHSYRPPRPAPACNNPDSPSYSDPGDDAEVDATIYLVGEKGIRKELPAELDHLYEDLEDEIFELAQQHYYENNAF